MSAGRNPKKEKLSEAERIFAAGVVEGLSQTDAAEAAGSKQPRNQGSRWAKKPNVQAYIDRLRKAAVAMAAVEDAGLQSAQAELPERATEDDSELLAPQRVDMVGVMAVADLNEALSHATRVMRSNIVAEAIQEDGSVNVEVLRKAPPGVLKSYKAKSRKVKDGEATMSAVVEEIAFQAESPLVAGQTLIRHYDAIDDREAARPVIERQQAVVLVSGEEGRELLRRAAAMIASGPQDVVDAAREP